MNDDFLNQFREPPPPEFAASLYQRISKKMIAQPKVLMFRRLAVTFSVLLAVLTITLAASPSARVLAANFLRQIGVLGLSDRPAGEPVLVASPSPEQLAQAGATSTPFSPSSQTGNPLEKAIREAGFQPFLPGYLPDGFTQISVVAAEYLDDQQIGHGMGIFADYVSSAGGYLSIQTTRFDGRTIDMPTGGLSVTDVTVNGQTGVWIEGLAFHSPHSSSKTINMLLWQEGDYVLAVQTDKLPLDEVLKIAEGLNQ
ncbi:MAG: DUF4367 domain-containing protein [Anaerolineales bacterium]